MGGFFQELAKKLADQWVALLVVPGALVMVTVWWAVELGHAHALDWRELTGAVSAAALAMGRQSGGTQAVVIVAVLLAAGGTGLAVQSLAGITRVLWLGQWLGPLAPIRRWRVGRRHARWEHCVEQRRALEREHPHQSRSPDQQLQIDLIADKANRIAYAEPGRPTWMGDRVHAVERIALHRYGIDLPFAWPRLWLVLPDTTRAEITAAHAAFAAAVAIGTWAWPYLMLGIFWWPASVVGAGVGITGWARARSAMTDLAALSESAVDLHGRALAVAFGVCEPGAVGPLSIAEGEQLTALIRKGR
ncbi:hypothetical protein SAMN05216174_11325 [Actinokineospora iranica]|uniref:Vegetative cell wall protein gp1 n=1 Tax=Actinokineospora iranica TaxID=1271860 RepID=A0A1G6VPI7_9PSEU|nr:hypothetical protein SAMN05216174_11325 [Actinokineospora iranica]